MKLNFEIYNMIGNEILRSEYLCEVREWHSTNDDRVNLEIRFFCINMYW